MILAVLPYQRELQVLLIFMVTIAQIVIESFPISSSGHVALITCIYQYFLPNYDVNFLSDEFMHALHIPTVIIIALFFVSAWSFLLINYKRTWRIILKLIMYTALIDIITALFFIIIKMKLCAFSIPLYVGFAITSIILFSLRWSISRNDTRLTVTNSIILGIVQGLALLPGISRFAAVYSATSWLGFDWKKSFAITWMVQWPLIAAAGAKSMLHIHEFSVMWTPEFCVVVLSTSIVAFLGMYAMYYLAQAKKMWWLSVYMIFPMLLAYCYCPGC